MSRFLPNISAFASLKDKVVVLTGGSNGIGAATVSRLYASGASVVFGDIATAAGEALVSNLKSRSGGGKVDFVKCNVTEYKDNYNLFKTAYDKYGRVDHAVACAGILEQGKWFDEELTVESVGEREETTAVLDVNMKGTCMFARIAVVFLRDGMQKGQNRSLTLLASVASIRESAGLFMYQVSLTFRKVRQVGKSHTANEA